MDKPLATLERGGCTADILETALPGQFSIQYKRADGSLIKEEELSGVSSYRQREQEILDRLEQLCSGDHPKSAPLSDAGEY